MKKTYFDDRKFVNNGETLQESACKFTVDGSAIKYIFALENELTKLVFFKDELWPDTL